MADVSHRPGDISGHPDVTEMRDRYARVLGGRDVVLVDGPVLLAGLYCAISPWTVHFSGAQPQLALNNLIFGIAIAVLGFGLAMGPTRMYGLSWALAAVGVWLIVAPWVVGSNPTTGTIVNNIIIGAITCLLGLAAAATLMRATRQSPA
ncbi:MAG: hypothetical protein QOF84_974 [Streptomyces sp.]|nr:hypothetical protein [Streptomyces sp.]MDX6346184.1 hypothetical protein [Streptomyces sp.]